MQSKIQDQLAVLLPGAIHIGGYLGAKLDICIHNGVMAVDYSRYTVPFRDKTDEGGEWAGEFWGKWFTSAALAYHYQPTALHREILDRAVESLLRTQAADGRISSYRQDFGHWDIWGRKYALLGLIAYYDQTGDIRSLEAASRAADQLFELTRPGKQKITETGLAVLEALSSSSILEPIALLYQRTGNDRYLQFSRHLVSLWSEPNHYTHTGIRLVENALAGVDPARIAAPKAYEMMSCYEGLCELYRATGESFYLEAVVKFAQSVRRKEIMIVGSGSSAELWCDGSTRQTMMLEQPMETCVTVTWIKLCYQLLRLTGDPLWADEMEISLYNALLGAMTADGNWWAYFSPLLGERMPSPLQVPSMQSSCCVANGPRGLLTVPGWAVMRGVSGPVINLYTAGNWRFMLENGRQITLMQSTRYPEIDRVDIAICPDEPQVFTLQLRIPAWSLNTRVTLNGQTIPATPGTYLKITREWHDKDCVSMQLDLRGRVVIAPGDCNHLAVTRGPVVLALDSRTVEPEMANLWLLHSQMQWKHDEQLNMDYILPQPVTAESGAPLWIDLEPCETKPKGVWMAFEVPFLYRPTHFFNHRSRSLTFYDYSSAGNSFSSENFFRVWLPQPLFMNNLFPQGSWKILDPTSDQRPQAPRTM